MNMHSRKCVEIQRRDIQTDSLAMIVMTEPKTVGHRLSSEKSAPCTLALLH